MTSNYNNIPNTTCTVDTSAWHKVPTATTDYIAGLFKVQYWLRKYGAHCRGDFRVDGNIIRFQSGEDATFFKLTFNLE